MDKLSAPKVVTNRILELNKIANENPLSIPIPVIAKFLDCDDDGVRAYLDNSPYPFGMAWRKDGKVNRAFKVPTAKFYLWYTNGIVFRRT